MSYIETAKAIIEEMLKGESADKLRNISEKISENYQAGIKTDTKPITRKLQAEVYAAVRMPATYAAVSAALGYALDTYEIEGKTLTDAGAGTGAATLAAADMMELDRITCLECEDVMMALGEKLIGQCGKLSENNALSRARWIKSDIKTYSFENSAAVVISSYMLNELGEDMRADVIEKLWNAAEELLLIVEPGTPRGYGVIMQARKLLMQKGAHIAAPCLHEKECAVKDNDWCHFTVRVPRSRLHKLIKNAEVPYEDEKFSYIAFTKEKSSAAGRRILRHPYIQKGNVRLRVCGENGIEDICVTRKDGELFKKARKADCGDVL